MEAMAETRLGGWWVIAMTFFIAMVLAVISLPESVPVELGYLRPEWVVLVLIYWVIALPHKVGIAVAWTVGLFLDVLLGSLLGLHAIACIVVAYISYNTYQRLRMFAIWQQSLIVLAIVGLYQLLIFWIESITGTVEWKMWYLLPSVISALVWPWVFLLLRSLRRAFDIN